ncbi:MAG: DUF2059 domain-containing protein [Bauldia sp.]|nr:DUF2059 domain-containing protein [Bauldia sp.]
MTPRWIRVFSLLAALVAAGSLSAPAKAQDISESHLRAALAVIAAQPAFEDFNGILPRLVGEVAGRLTLQRLDLYKEISAASMDVGLQLAARRSDLNNDLARIWARAFTEEELTAIAAFFQSPAGRKLSELGPQMIESSNQAAQTWAERLGEELLQRTVAELQSRGIQL